MKSQTLHFFIKFSQALIFLFFFTRFFSLHASELVVKQYAVSEVNTLITDLNAGNVDIFELTESGDYTITSTTSRIVTVTKNITIRAAKKGLTSRPVIKMNAASTSSQTTLFYTNSPDLTLNFEGVEFDGYNTGTSSSNQPIFLIAETGSSNLQINVKNCYFHRFENASTYNSIMVMRGEMTSLNMQDSHVNNSKGKLFYFLRTTELDVPSVGNLILTNNIFSNIGGTNSYVFFYQSNSSTNQAKGNDLKVDHCTFYNISNNRTFTTRKFYGVAEFKNSIFVNVAEKGFNISPVAIDYCYLAGIAQYSSTIPSGTRTNEFGLSPVPAFADVSNLDFTLTNGSSFICGDSLVAGYIGSKTFNAIKNHGVFLKSGHENYRTFSNNELNIITVTNLNNDGVGSLRWAISQKGPRVVVFEVGGVVDLDQRALPITEPYLFIAGQTSPEPGITLIKGTIQIATHDVIMQHISSRPGDCGLPKQSGWTPNGAITISAYNVVVDHCSFTWAVDENLSLWGPIHEGEDKLSRNITFSNNIISEGLDSATHNKGPHSMGTLVHDYATGVAVVKNVLSHNATRNPLVKPNAKAYIANNIIYNPKTGAIHSSWPVSEYVDYPDSLRRAKATVIGNILIPGVNSVSYLRLMDYYLSVYQQDNVVSNYLQPLVNQPTKIASTLVDYLTEQPIQTDRYTPISSQDVASEVLPKVGSRPLQRDSIDIRIIHDVINKNGSIIDSQDEVGGYPSYTMTSHELQIPEEDIELWLEILSNQLIDGDTMNNVRSSFEQVQIRSDFIITDKKGLFSKVDCFIDIFTIDGKKIKSGIVNNNELIRLNSGVYIVRSNLNGLISIQKIII
jgi:hypothetical protein